MTRPTKQLNKLEQKFEKLEKKHLPLSASIAKTKASLKASRSALHIVKKATESKLAAKPRRKSKV
jgi:hypothetical protein